jgi:hypothetical protein
VTMPLILIVIAAAIASLPRAAAAMLAAAVIVVALTGLRDNHRTQGFYLDAQHAVGYVRAHELPGDVVLSPSSPGAALPLSYYGIGRLHDEAGGTAAANALVASRRHRLWLMIVVAQNVSEASVGVYERPLVASIGYRLDAVRVFPASVPLAVLLLVPRRS